MIVRFRVVPLWVMLVAFVTLVTGGTASAAASIGPETRVRAFDTPVEISVAATGSERPASVGCLRPSWAGTVVGACVATEAAARNLADSMPRLPGVGDPRTVAVLDTPSGGRYPGVSGSGSAPIHAYSRRWTACLQSTQSPFRGGCAEIQCLSAALNAGDNLAGGTIVTARVRGLNSAAHGTPIPACSTCRHVLDEFGVNG
jgi:hypothetical protein